MILKFVDCQEIVLSSYLFEPESRLIILCHNSDCFTKTQSEVVDLGLANMVLPFFSKKISIDDVFRLVIDTGFERLSGSNLDFYSSRGIGHVLVPQNPAQNPKDKGKIAVLLRQWDAYELTRSCIEDLLLTTYQNIDIVVLDDASLDLSYIRLFIEFPQIHVIRSQKRLEYCLSFNFLAKYSEVIRAAYIFILNNDTKAFSPNIFEELLEGLKDQSVGIVSSRVMDFDGNFRLKQDRTWLGIKFNIATEGYLIPIPVWKKVGGFNPTLVRFTEDLEFVYQLQQLGFSQLRMDSVSFDHLGSGSSARQNFVPVYFSARNLIWIQKLYFPNTGLHSILLRSFQKTWPVVLRLNSKDKKRHLFAKLTYLSLGIFRGLFSKMGVRCNEMSTSDYLSKSPLGFFERLK